MSKKYQRADKNPISTFGNVMPASGKVTIANNPKTYDTLPKGVPVQATTTENTYTLVKGLKVYEALTAGTALKVYKENLLGVGDVIVIDTVNITVNAIDYSNDAYDLVTLSANVTVLAGEVHSQELTKKVYFTTDLVSIDNDKSEAYVGVFLDGTFDLRKANLHANITSADLGGNALLLTEVFS